MIKDKNSEQVVALLQEYKELSQLDKHWDKIRTEYFMDDTESIEAVYGFSDADSFFENVVAPSVLNNMTMVSLKRAVKSLKYVDKQHKMIQDYLAKDEFNIVREHSMLISNDISKFLEDGLVKQEEALETEDGVLEA